MSKKNSLSKVVIVIITKTIGDSGWAPWVSAGSYIFVAKSTFGERHLLQSAKWLWHGRRFKVWWTDQIDRAARLAEYADNTCKEELLIHKNKNERSLELSRKAAIEANFPCPIGVSYFPFQNVGIQYMLERKNTLLGDEMGTGKTVQAAGFINVVKEIEFVLIICPNTIKINWKRELEKWLVRKMKIEIANSQYLPDPTTCNIVIMNYETARKFCYKPTTREKNSAIKKDQEKLSELYDKMEKTKLNLEYYEGFETEKTDRLKELLSEQEEAWLKTTEKISGKN